MLDDWFVKGRIKRPTQTGDWCKQLTVDFTIRYDAVVYMECQHLANMQASFCVTKLETVMKPAFKCNRGADNAGNMNTIAINDVDSSVEHLAHIRGIFASSGVKLIKLCKRTDVNNELFRPRYISRRIL